MADELEQPGAGPTESAPGQTLFATENPETPSAETTAPAAEGAEQPGLLGETTADAESVLTDEELEEIEHAGKRFKVPKEAKDAFLRQQDYTRKTQEVAEARRQWEATQQTGHRMLQLREATLTENAQLMAIDQRLEQFKQVNWQQAISDNPQGAQAAQMELMNLRDQRAQLAQGIAQKQQAMAFHQQQLVAKQVEEGRRELERDIKGWSPELQGKLMQTAKTYGFRDEELAQVSDPRTVKLLHDAYLYRQSLAKPRVAPAPPVVLPKPVTQVTGAAATNTKAFSDLSVAEVMASRAERRRK